MATKPVPGRIWRVLTPVAGRFMEGDDVKVLQRNLRKSSPSLKTLKIDGEYGPATASAVAYWKRYIAGYPAKNLRHGVVNAIGIDGQRILNGDKQVPAAWTARGKVRQRFLAKQVQAAEAQAAMGDRALELAERRVGLKEDPAGSNEVPQLQRLAADLDVQPWIARMGYAWCAFFYALMYLAAGSKAAADGLRGYKYNVLYTPTLLELAMTGAYGMRAVGWSEIQPGDGLLVNFPGGDPRVDHIAMASDRPNGDTVATVEGNTSAGTAGSQSNGGMVAARQRNRDQVRLAYRMSNTY